MSYSRRTWRRAGLFRDAYAIAWTSSTVQVVTKLRSTAVVERFISPHRTSYTKEKR